MFADEEMTVAVTSRGKSERETHSVEVGSSA